MKRAIVCTLVASMLLAGLTGCGSDSGNSQASTASESSASSQTTSSSAEVPQEVVDVSIFTVEHPDMRVDTDALVIKTLAERTGVRLIYEQAPSDSSEERFNLMIAGGDLPDLIYYDITPIKNTTENGPFMVLDDVINNMDNLSSVIQDKPEVMKEMRNAEGHMYFFPQLDAIRANNMQLVRQDWLDKLNLDYPTTTDEYYEMLKAFKEQDPNGNGEADEIPYTTRHKTHGLTGIIEFFGISREWFVEDDEVKHGMVDPRMKDAVTYLNKLYSEGLIDPDYLTNTQDIWTTKISTNLVGTFWDLGSRLESFNEIISGNVETGPFVGMLPPAAEGVTPGTFNQKTYVSSTGCAVSKNTEHLAEIEKLFNYIYSEEGGMLLNFGIEGETYTIDGEEVTTLLEGDEGNQIGLSCHLPFIKDIRKERNQGVVVTAAREEYEKILRPIYPNLPFTEEEKEINTSIYTDMQTFIDENFDKFVMGVESLDNWDNFVAQINEMGMDQLLEVQNAAYDRYNQ
ncbi:MAG: extracellular solute-binding protein [Candidatus Merdivicinus sp.]|jgi:putative aldouronate transport system substrate-binding protein